MSKRMLIDAVREDEQRVVVLDKGTVVEADFNSASKTQIKGNIYLARITRVEPSLQAAFVDFGHGKHGFLPFAEIHPDYFQIPVADREALVESVQEAVARRQTSKPDEAPEATAAQPIEPQAAPEELAGKANKDPKPKKTRRVRKSTQKAEAEAEEGQTQASEALASSAADVQEEKDEKKETKAPEKKPRGRSGKKPVTAAIREDIVYADANESIDTVHPQEDEQEGKGEANPTLEETHKRISRSRSRRKPATQSVAAEKPNRPPRRHRDDEMDDLSDTDFEARIMTRAILSKRYKIQEVIKRNQVVLVQASKEERGDKGAAMTTYLSLPGRYCVLMPNTHRAGGISRRISSVTDRKRLKSVLDELTIPSSMSLIVRTAGAERTKQEIKRDHAYLSRMWDEIRETTLNSFAPALIYDEANLIKRAIRDIYESDTQEVLVTGEASYKTAKAFMKTLTPSHASRVKRYEGETPLFQAYAVEEMLEALNNPTVTLPSGGYLFINQTEALVAIDVNSGKATRERNIEETALATNLEAAHEAARQLRLRDLAGLVVIDFIDMDETRNVAAVEKALKEALKPDRARIQVGHISQFGLMELSRQRLRPSVAEATMSVCPTCHGTGYIKSNEATGRSLIRQVEAALQKGGIEGVKLFAGTELALSLANDQRAQLARLESAFSVSIEIAIDIHIGPAQYRGVYDRGGRFEAFGNAPTYPSAKRGRGKSKDRAEPRTPEPQSERQDDTRAEKPKRSARSKNADNPDVETHEASNEEALASPESSEEGERKKRRRGKRGGRSRSRKQDEMQEAQESALTMETTHAGEGAKDPSKAPQPDLALRSENAQSVEEKPKRKRPRKPKAEAETHAPAPVKEASPPAPKPTQGEALPADTTPSKKRGWWNRVMGM